MRLLRPCLALLVLAAACGKPAPPPPPPPPPPEPVVEEPPPPPPPPEPARPAIDVDERDRAFEGLLEWGTEGNGFRSCDDGARLPIELGTPGLNELAVAYMKLRVPPYEPVYVKLTGRRVAVEGQAMLAITSHELMRERGAGDCPKLPPNPKRQTDPGRRGLPTDR